jgi:hypothetical protein
MSVMDTECKKLVVVLALYEEYVLEEGQEQTPRNSEFITFLKQEECRNIPYIILYLTGHQ